MIDTSPFTFPACTRPTELRTSREAVEQLREAAAAGRLTSVHELTPTLAANLRRAAYELAWPLVWSTHTRPLEGRKGHQACTRSVATLADGCLDGFHDDVEAVVGYLFAYGKHEIGNVEGWITSRIRAATVDGHRRRRGVLGAQQRPRVPGWLAAALHHDPWLVTLARLVIEWVGVRSTAGNRLWPVGVWGEIRDQLAPGRRPAHPADVERDVEHVLQVMRTAQPRWYAAYVEAPLGRKQAPVAARHTDDPSVSPLELAACDDDAGLSRLADAAIAAIRTGLAAGGEPRAVVERVLATLFLGPAPTSVEIADPPLARPPLDERVSMVLASEDAISTLVESVLAIVTDRRPAPSGPVVEMQR